MKQHAADVSANLQDSPTGERRIEYLPLAEIQHAPRNPRRHDVAGIRASLDLFGLGELPLVDERTGRLVAGHGRLDRLAEMAAGGQAPPDGVRLADSGGWLVPVIRGWASRDDQHAEAYLVASNKLTVNGGWDETELAAMLADLDSVELLGFTGFDTAELDALLRSSDHLGNQATAFLADLTTAPGDSSAPVVTAAEAETAPPPAPGVAYVAMSWTCDTTQRDTVRAAIRAAQQHHQLPTSTEALVAIAQHYLDTTEGSP